MEILDELNENELQEIEDFKELYDKYHSGGALRVMRGKSNAEILYCALVFANDVLYERLEKTDEELDEK